MTIKLKGHSTCDRCGKQEVREHKRHDSTVDLPEGWRNLYSFDHYVDLCLPCVAIVRDAVKPPRESA